MFVELGGGVGGAIAFTHISHLVLIISMFTKT